MDIADIFKTIKLSTAIGIGCPYCKERLSGLKCDDIDTGINHLIQEHEFVLLHVGSETNYDPSPPTIDTIAILGNAKPPEEILGVFDLDSSFFDEQDKNA